MTDPTSTPTEALTHLRESLPADPAHDGPIGVDSGTLRTALGCHWPGVGTKVDHVGLGACTVIALGLESAPNDLNRRKDDPNMAYVRFGIATDGEPDETWVPIADLRPSGAAPDTEGAAHGRDASTCGAETDPEGAAQP